LLLNHLLMRLMACPKAILAASQRKMQIEECIWSKAAEDKPLHQQKKTCLQLPYNALLCLIEPVRHNKAL